MKKINLQLSAQKTLKIEALEMMRNNKIYSIAITDQKNLPVGIIRMHDLIEAGLV